MYILLLGAMASEDFPEPRTAEEVASQATSLVVARPKNPFQSRQTVDGRVRWDDHWVVERLVCGADVPEDLTVVPPHHAVMVAIDKRFAKTGESSSPIVPFLKEGDPERKPGPRSLLFLTKKESEWSYTVSRAWMRVPQKARLTTLVEHCNGSRLPPGITVD